MTWKNLIAFAALSSASLISAPPLISSLDTSYVVQLHTSRDSFLHSSNDGTSMLSQLMTTESGKLFECFLPLLSHSSHKLEEQETREMIDVTDNEEMQQVDDVLVFGRAAVQQLPSHCLHYVDIKSAKLYEICAGVKIRQIGSKQAEAEVQVEATGATSNPTKATGIEAAELGTYMADASRPALIYDEFVIPETEDQVKNYLEPLFTQTFGDGKQQIQVQFICSATTEHAAVSAVQWKQRHSTTDGPREVAAFLIGSKAFCDPRHSDADSNDLHTVRSLLEPLKDANTCITRSEGWWTYEFCFGKSLRQYHRDRDGRITVEFFLGTFDVAGNRKLERLGSALVSEHIDATHEVSRPAYLELYDHGTLCKEFESHAPRKAKVYYFCSQGGTSHHILMVKETQTCMYTVKVSSPVLCDHPHFVTDEQTSNESAKILHCIPAKEDATAAAEWMI